MPQSQSKIPRATLERLPLYYRFVNSLKIKGIDRVSFKTISETLNIESATIRRDFSYFGRLSKKGYGYDAESLLEFFKTEISDGNNIRVAIVSVGNSGRTLFTYNFSMHDEMTTTVTFDIDKDIAGTTVGEVTVKYANDISSELRKQNINVVVLTTPGGMAQSISDRLIKADVKDILNSTPVRIDVPNNVQIHRIDLGIELQSLLFFIKGSSN